MDALDGVVDADHPLLTPPCGAGVRSATLASVAALCSFWLTRANTLTIRRESDAGGGGGSHVDASSSDPPSLNPLADAVTRPRAGCGLLSVSNHTSTLDDPSLFAGALPVAHFATDHLTGGARWALCARDVCFKNAFLTRFFLSGKTLPVDRGAGAVQPSTLAAGAALAAGGWVHVFPEGRIGYSGTLLPVRWGVGALVCECVSRGAPPPSILPFHHAGMGAVMPRGARVPRVGQRVTVTVGEEIDVSDLARGCSAPDPSPTWAAIAARVETALKRLEAASPPNPDQRTDADFEKERRVGSGGGRQDRM